MPKQKKEIENNCKIFLYRFEMLHTQLLDKNLTLNIFEIATHNSIRYRLVRGRDNRELEYRKAEV